MTDLQAAAMTLATARAVRALKQKLRDDGKRPQEIRTSNVRGSIGDYLKSNPQLLETAAEDIERWTLAGVFGNRCRAKLLNSAQRPKR
jgi:hypothetical protein